MLGWRLQVGMLLAALLPASLGGAGVSVCIDDGHVAMAWVLAHCCGEAPAHEGGPQAARQEGPCRPCLDIPCWPTQCPRPARPAHEGAPPVAAPGEAAVEAPQVGIALPPAADPAISPFPDGLRSIVLRI